MLAISALMREFRGVLVVSDQTENSVPPFLALRNRLICKPMKGLIQSKDGCPPNTDLIPSHLSLRSHVGFSLFSRSISVSSLHME